MKKASILSLFVLVLTACEIFNKTAPPGNPIARVGSNFLYESDVQHLVSERISKSDSELLVTNYIDQWITEQVINLTAEREVSNQNPDFEDALEKYKFTLLKNALEEKIILENLDSVISEDEIKTAYNQYKSYFTLDNPIFQIRLFGLQNPNSKQKILLSKLPNANQKELKELDDLGFQFAPSYNLNDSIWLELPQLYNLIPASLFPENKIKQKNIFLEATDSLGFEYYVWVKNYLPAGESPPFSYLKENIRGIILLNRKEKIISNYYRDLLQEAKQKKQIEIFHQN